VSVLFLNLLPAQPCLSLNLNLVFSPVDGNGRDDYILGVGVPIVSINIRELAFCLSLELQHSVGRAEGWPIPVFVQPCPASTLTLSHRKRGAI